MCQPHTWMRALSFHCTTLSVCWCSYSSWHLFAVEQLCSFSPRRFRSGRWTNRLLDPIRHTACCTALRFPWKNRKFISINRTSIWFLFRSTYWWVIQYCVSGQIVEQIVHNVQFRQFVRIIEGRITQCCLFRWEWKISQWEWCIEWVIFKANQMHFGSIDDFLLRVPFHSNWKYQFQSYEIVSRFDGTWSSLPASANGSLLT